MTRRDFPFSAIVGHEDVKLALLLCAVNPRIGGVLLRGERGTAKSTIARGLRALLPPVVAVEGCPCSCDPAAGPERCDDCLARDAGGTSLSGVMRPAPFVELPVSATEDRVVGTLDIEAAVRHGERRFQSGLLAAANRGVLYVDEVNLLEDHLVDSLLDAAATGINIVEREGVSFSHPSRFVLVGTMNPEEGELRPQLTDRFGLCATIAGLTTIDDRAEVVERTLAFEADPDAFCAQWEQAEQALAQRLAAARGRLHLVRIFEEHRTTVATLALQLSVQGHRADLVILRGAQALAALEDRDAVADDDIARVAHLALAHRLSPDSSETDARLAELPRYLDAARQQAVMESTPRKKKRLMGQPT